VTTLSYTVGSGCSATRTVTVSTLGITNPGDGGTISVVPNPNKGSFSISGTLGVPLFSASVQEEEVNIEVTDMVGQVVYRDKVISSYGNIHAEVSLGNLVANGMYLLSIRSDGERRVFHVVVER
jgi:hypothetical protein